MCHGWLGLHFSWRYNNLIAMHDSMLIKYSFCSLSLSVPSPLSFSLPSSLYPPLLALSLYLLLFIPPLLALSLPSSLSLLFSFFSFLFPHISLSLSFFISLPPFLFLLSFSLHALSLSLLFYLVSLCSLSLSLCFFFVLTHYPLSSKMWKEAMLSCKPSCSSTNLNQ